MKLNVIHISTEPFLIIFNINLELATILHHVVCNVMIQINQAIQLILQLTFVHLVYISVHYVKMVLIVPHAQPQELLEMEEFVYVPIIHYMMIKPQDNASNVLIQAIAELAKEKEFALIAILTIISDSIQSFKHANVLLHLPYLLLFQHHLFLLLTQPVTLVHRTVFIV